MAEGFGINDDANDAGMLGGRADEGDAGQIISSEEAAGEDPAGLGEPQRAGEGSEGSGQRERPGDWNPGEQSGGGGELY